MGEHLTEIQAWTDFFNWIRQSEKWADLDRSKRQYLYKTEKARRDGHLGYDRVKKLLTKYAPDRYKFEETITLLQK